jgi:hypothetical protein
MVLTKANIIYVRGKKKVGYEFKIEAAWTGETGEENVSGTIELPEVSDYDPDFEVINALVRTSWI